MVIACACLFRGPHEQELGCSRFGRARPYRPKQRVDAGQSQQGVSEHDMAMIAVAMGVMDVDSRAESPTCPRPLGKQTGKEFPHVRTDNVVRRFAAAQDWS